ncbi:MAG: c-type cytochrome [Devosia sp.]
MLARTLSLLLGAFMALSAVPAAAEDLGRMQAQFGNVIYQLYCVACHGQGGKGDGPAAAALATRPADLTTLANRNGGIFPVERVTAAIDGRVEVVGHINLAMPPWGRLFAHEFEAFPEGTILEALIARRIAHIVAYLRTLQEE